MQIICCCDVVESIIPNEPDPELSYSTSVAASMKFGASGTRLVSISNSGSGDQDEKAADFGGTIGPPGYSNNIITFDGSNEALVAQGSGGQGTGDFSVAMVIKSSSTAQRIILDKGATVWSFGANSGGRLEFSVSDGTTTDTNATSTTVWDGDAHLILFVHDATANTYTLAVDNSAVTGSPWSSTYTGTLVANQGHLTIGADSDLSQFWTGSMMNIMIWQKALSGQEQSAVYDWAGSQWLLGSQG